MIDEIGRKVSGRLLSSALLYEVSRSVLFLLQGYSGRDSLLLPLILGEALLILLLAVCICYSVRRRRQKTLRRQAIGVSHKRTISMMTVMVILTEQK
jgi:hypothetical protein